MRRRDYRSRLVAPGDRTLFAGADGRLRIPLERGRRIAGLLRDAAGGTRPAVDLRLEPAAEEGTAADDKDAAAARETARTGPDGSWTFDGFGPGAYEIVYGEETAPQQGRIETRRRVRVGAGADAGIDLDGRRDGIEISGVLGGMEGRESLGATIILRRIDEGGIDEVIRLRTYRDWGWRYRFPALARGRYGVAIEYYSKSGNTRANLPPIEIAAAGGIDLALPPGAP